MPFLYKIIRISRIPKAAATIWIIKLLEPGNICQIIFLFFLFYFILVYIMFLKNNSSIFEFQKIFLAQTNFLSLFWFAKYRMGRGWWISWMSRVIGTAVEFCSFSLVLFRFWSKFQASLRNHKIYCTRRKTKLIILNFKNKSDRK